MMQNETDEAAATGMLANAPFVTGTEHTQPRSFGREGWAVAGGGGGTGSHLSSRSCSPSAWGRARCLKRDRQPSRNIHHRLRSELAPSVVKVFIDHATDLAPVTRKRAPAALTDYSHFRRKEYMGSVNKTVVSVPVRIIRPCWGLSWGLGYQTEQRERCYNIYIIK
jgi:hypothetical protein